MKKAICVFLGCLLIGLTAYSAKTVQPLAESTGFVLEETTGLASNAQKAVSATKKKTTTKKAASSTKKKTTAKKAASTTKKKTTAAAPKNVVPKKYIGSKKSGTLTWAQYQQARAAAQALVGKYAGLSREQMLKGIYQELRAPVDKNQIAYSMEAPHYADPYGYLVLQVASCAGSARTAGLCCDILGIPWEHVNPGAFSHQWARIKVGNTYWICDPYGMYVGPEPSPYKHPYIAT